VTSTSQADTYHSYLPGGTVTIAVNEWTSQISEAGKDPRGLGRWSFLRTKGKLEQKLLIITVYQVCKSSIHTSGPSMAFMQQFHSLQAQGIKNPDPRGHFCLALSAFLTKYPNDLIILAGDLNSWLQNPNDDRKCNVLVERHHLVDVLIHCHGPDSEIPTRK
jgi:hypothetical protein